MVTNTSIATLHINLWINLGEPIRREPSTKDVEVDIGDNYNLDCKAQGYPRPNISWIRADSKPLHGGIAKFNVIFDIYMFILVEFLFFSILCFKIFYNMKIKKYSCIFLFISNQKKENHFDENFNF